MQPDLTLAYVATMRHEGLYSVDPVDPGGETWRGISRVNWPGCEVWRLLLKYRDRDGILDPEAAAADPEIERATKEFYRVQFWQPLRCADLVDHRVAAELFDTAVNMGTTVAAQMMQRAINALTPHGEPLALDGRVGPVTVAAVRATAERGRLASLAKAMNCLQGARYIELTERSPKLRRFAHGWLANRVAL